MEKLYNRAMYKVLREPDAEGIAMLFFLFHRQPVQRLRDAIRLDWRWR